jgi:hypothetical protein
MIGTALVYKKGVQSYSSVYNDICNLYSLFLFSKHARHYLCSAFLEVGLTKQDSISLILVKMFPYKLSLLHIGSLMTKQKHLSLNKSCLYKRPGSGIKSFASSSRSLCIDQIIGLTTSTACNFTL